jgi:DNA-binding LytR/AlgR family response regulator
MPFPFSVDKVIYLVFYKGLVTVRLENDDIFEINENIDLLIKKLLSNNFIKINQNYFINVNCIDEIIIQKRKKYIIIRGIYIKISRRKLYLFRNK